MPNFKDFFSRTNAIYFALAAAPVLSPSFSLAFASRYALFYAIFIFPGTYKPTFLIPALQVEA